MSLQKTLVILKPDAIERGLVGKILRRFEDNGLRILAMKMLYATSEQLDKHFPSSLSWIEDMGRRARERVKNELSLDPDEYFGVWTPYGVGKIIKEGCRHYYFSGPIVALVLSGPSAVAHVRVLIGKTLPSQAKRGTIRGDFGIREDLEELRSGAARNLVHASDSHEEAKREMAAWFSSDELLHMSERENYS